MPLLTATSAFGFQRRPKSSPQWRYLYQLCMMRTITEKNNEKQKQKLLRLAYLEWQLNMI